MRPIQAAIFAGVLTTVSVAVVPARAQVPCTDGLAAGFPCDGVDLLSQVGLAELGSVFVNDIWGWTDPLTLRDYALLGSSEGMTVVDISDPTMPVIVGQVPTHTTAGGDFWRDIKVYADHAFIVSENSGHGMQIFDLTEVRGAAVPPVVFSATARYDGVGNAHNLAINEDTGYAYILGSGTCSGGLHMVDISDPVNPIGAGCFADHGYVHNSQCVVYEGPDDVYLGKEICFNAVPDGADAISIVDVTDKSNVVSLALLTYPVAGYSDQGWLTPDQRYFLHNDELDEVVQGINTTTRIFDVRDLDAPTLVAAVAHDTTSIGKQIFTEGRYAYASHYTSGFRVFDITGVAAGELPEVGYFDVYPLNDNPTFEGGAWSNYPYFHQKGIIAVSSIDQGLFVLRFPEASWVFGGFLSPVDGQAINSVKAGQIVALKWRLTDEGGAPVIDLMTVSVTVTSFDCALGTTDDQVEEVSSGESGLQNLGDGYYQFNWKTPKSYAGSCKTLHLDLGDGSDNTADFQFRR